MKKYMAFVLAIMLAAAVFLLPQTGAVDGFGAAKGAELISAWFGKYTPEYDPANFTEDTAVIVPYYTDGDLYVFGIHGKTTRSDIVHLYIGDYTLACGSDDLPYFYQNGEVMPLAEAYAAGLADDGVLSAMQLGFVQMTRLWMYNLYDVNEDGSVTVSDVISLRQWISAGTGKDTVGQRDIDRDGAVTVSDVIALRARLLAG